MDFALNMCHFLVFVCETMVSRGAAFLFKIVFFRAVLCHSDSQHDLGNFGDAGYFEQGASPWLPAICSFPDVFQGGASCKLQRCLCFLIHAYPYAPCMVWCIQYSTVCEWWFIQLGETGPLCVEKYIYIFHAWSMAYSYQ